MLSTLALLLTIVPSRADSVGHYYSLGDVEALVTLCSEPVSREQDLLCRYRLYPLTSQPQLLEDLPSTLDGGTAREKALLAGLWGYRAASGSVFRAMKSGRRAGRLMAEAREIDPEEPFLLLIEGQSYLFRPGIFGGSRGRALESFRQLQRSLAVRTDEVIDPMEADLWIWYTLEQMNDPAADAVRRSIESRNPPPLYRDFLANPPA
jgi:hypothetical protein